MISDWTIRISDVATVIALLLGPVVAVWITFLWQARREKRAAKLALFLLLLGERKKTPSTAAAAGLNTIEVVFSDCAAVIALWHRYYLLLNSQPSEERGHVWIELLQAMAVALNYPKMTQTTIDKFYLPQGHADQQELQEKIGKNFLRVLEGTNRFLVDPKA